MFFITIFLNFTKKILEICVIVWYNYKVLHYYTFWRKFIKMSIFEVISAIVLIIACIFIVVVVLVKDTKTQMSQTISGSSSDSFYQKNAGRTKEAMLNKATVVAAVIFFVLAIAVNVINVYWGGAKEDDTSSDSSVVSEVSDSSSENTSSSSESSADSSAESSSTESSADSSSSAQ